VHRWFTRQLPWELGYVLARDDVLELMRHHLSKYVRQQSADKAWGYARRKIDVTDVQSKKARNADGEIDESEAKYNKMEEK
jgi:hypothetical protein